ncbi:uncharacterized protein Z519_01825 [Cladophialophora bantiana CBS 173.52]|uniref:Uncharacterized protein n=1 Tax=Cladophialophora bantiana (strain ATCC 10958 / CBS 173.52 / CDC B-1940 / NIH 8579) TaxID=1442370 RepID=A0A0D2F827_CLAB1|nr:uncharacterized protein Z519_01825 [Cladophialophora bantiana CBS 173.52]KIW98241.1 hypothetical protein Z519_01825 [Cladophialophora bantiana CBS 173.52]
MASTDMNISLGSKVAIITGAASGLGKAIAKAFLHAGAKVVACDINASMLEECHKELSPLGALHKVVADISLHESAPHLIKEAVDNYGKLDILVNNAGIMDRFDPIGDIDMDFWDRVISTNLTAPARISKYAVQEFMRHGEAAGTTAAGCNRGVIMNVGSINGFRGGCGGVAYVCAKHALVGLTRNTASFYSSKGIRCNIIMPGAMKTNIRVAYKDGFNEEGRAICQKLAEVNPGEVNLDQLGKLVAFACSDDASYLNGAIISADHGWQAI